MQYENRTVTDRVLLLGLDSLYRARMKQHESGELLACAHEVADALALPPSGQPVEGYYTESRQLASYFRLMRTLQTVDRQLAFKVADLAAYRRLVEVTSSPIFGIPVEDDRLIPRSRNSLTAALEETDVSRWAVPSLMATAAERAVSSDDCSLVALAALSHDAAVVTALGETVVLYTDTVLGAAPFPPTPRYIWAVSEELARRAEVFIDRFNTLFNDDLPMPHPRNAALFWAASNEATIAGRCVRLGLDDSTEPIRHYHWAVGGGWTGGVVRYEVHDFWDTTLWTTETYRSDPESPRWREARRLSN
jgi:hypothetical protein